MKKIFFAAVLLFTGILTACRTTGCFSGTAPLVIMIVDENGQAITDFKVVLSNFNKAENGITNTSGVCVFENIPSGQYEIGGQKNGYSKLTASQIHFTDKSEVFCVRAYSGDFVFEQTARLFESGNYPEGINLLETLVCEKKSALNAAVCFYKAYAYAALDDHKKVKNEIKKMKNASEGFAEKYSLAVEKLMEKKEE